MVNPSLTIYDLSGKKVLEHINLKEQEELDVSVLPKGTYQVRLNSSGEMLGNTKFIKL